MRVSMRRVPVTVNRGINRDGNEADVPVGDAAFRDDGLGEISDGGGLATQDRHLKAAVVVQMHVHRCHLEVVMGMMRVRQALRQLARVVAENIGERSDALLADPVLCERLVQAETGEIANCLGSVLVMMALHEGGQLRREFFRNADGDSFHLHLPRRGYRKYEICGKID